MFWNFRGGQLAQMPPPWFRACPHHIFCLMRQNRPYHFDMSYLEVFGVQTRVGVDVWKFFEVGAGVLKRGAGEESESEKCDFPRRSSLAQWYWQHWLVLFVFWPDQDWIRLQFFSKLADQDWIGLRKFMLFWCDYSNNIKNFSCDPISQVC